MPKKVLCVLPVEQRHKEKLERAGRDCEFTYVPAKDVTDEQIAEAEIIIGNIPAERVHASENLELLQLSTAGAGTFIAEGVLSKKTLLTNSTGAYSQAVAEHAFASCLMLQKKLHLYRSAQEKHSWTDFGTVTSMSDAVVLVVGLGDIGCYFASLCKALGAYTIGVKRRKSAKPDCVDELYMMDSLRDVLPRADVIFSILPGTKDTYHVYTDELFDLMKSSAIFINCGRGAAVDGVVLYRALSEGKIASAAVDVTDPEPLPADSKLWDLDNLLITPHISGYYHLPRTFERIIDIAADNLDRYTSGRELKNIVDLSTGYKK